VCIEVRRVIREIFLRDELQNTKKYIKEELRTMFSQYMQSQKKNLRVNMDRGQIGRENIIETLTPKENKGCKLGQKLTS